MPTPPYAKLLVKVNGGAPTSGPITVLNGDTIQFVYESAAFWAASPPARLEFYAYPDGWAGPGVPWLTRTVNITVGGVTYPFTNYYYDGSVEPPAFLMPAGPTWGKFLVRLFVNGGLTNGVADVGLLDETTALEIIDPDVGLHGLARYEAIQFGGAETWVKDHAENLTLIATGIAAAGALGAAVPQPVGTVGAAGVSTNTSRQDHVHALGEATLRAVTNTATAQVNWNNQRLGLVANPAVAQDVATKASSEAAATAAAQNETNWRTAAAALTLDAVLSASAHLKVDAAKSVYQGTLIAVAGDGATSLTYGSNATTIDIGDNATNDAINIRSTSADGIHLVINGSDGAYLDGSAVHTYNLNEISISTASPAEDTRRVFTSGATTKSISTYGAFGQTTDALANTLVAIAVADNTSLVIDARVSAFRTTGDVGHFAKVLTVKRFGGGAATIVGVLKEPYSDASDDLGWAVTIDVDGGNNARLRGQFAGTTDWFADLKITTLTP